MVDTFTSSSNCKKLFFRAESESRTNIVLIRGLITSRTCCDIDIAKYKYMPNNMFKRHAAVCADHTGRSDGIILWDL